MNADDIRKWAAGKSSKEALLGHVYSITITDNCELLSLTAYGIRNIVIPEGIRSINRLSNVSVHIKGAERIILPDSLENLDGDVYIGFVADSGCVIEFNRDSLFNTDGTKILMTNTVCVRGGLSADELLKASCIAGKHTYFKDALTPEKKKGIIESIKDGVIGSAVLMHLDKKNRLNIRSSIVSRKYRGVYCFTRSGDGDRLYGGASSIRGEHMQCFTEAAMEIHSIEAEFNSLSEKDRVIGKTGREVTDGSSIFSEYRMACGMPEIWLSRDTYEAASAYDVRLWIKRGLVHMR